MRQVAHTINRRSLRAIYAGTAVILVVAAVLSVRFLVLPKKHVILGDIEVAVAIADTPELRDKGLSKREKLGVNEGMFFIFENPQQYGFWMKDMNFPIDIIWFDENQRIVYAKQDAEPSSYPEIFTPSASAQYVLEVPAGFFAFHRLKLGDTIEIPR